MSPAGCKPQIFCRSQPYSGKVGLPLPENGVNTPLSGYEKTQELQPAAAVLLGLYLAGRFSQVLIST